MKKMKITMLALATLSSLPIAACYTDNNSKVSNKNGRNIIHQAVLENQLTFGQNPLKETLKQLSLHEKNHLINQIDHTQTTPLQYAMLYNDCKSMEILLQFGAEPSLLSPMPYSVKKELAKEKLTPMHLAVICEDIKMMQLLLDHNAHIDEVASNNATALGLAVMQRNIKLTLFLLQHKANPNITCNKRRLIDIALENKNIPIVLYLLHYGVKPNSSELLMLQDLFGSMLIKAITQRKSQYFNTLINVITDYNIMSFDHLQKYVAQLFVSEGILKK